MADWLPEDHLVWFVIDVVDTIDTSAFHSRHPNDGPGRPAYDPEIMLALLVYAYCCGMRSSRRIEAACVTDVAFKVAAAGLCPDHRTIAEFRASHEAAIEDFFVEVLRLCAATGLACLGTIAIDGTKMAASASLRANRSAAWIRAEVREMLAEATAADERDAAIQPTLDGHLPEHLARRGSRRARLEAALAEVEAQEQAHQGRLDEQAAKAAAEAAEGRKLRGRKPTDPHATLVRAEADVAAARTKLAKAGRPGAARRAEAELASAEQALVAARERAAAAPPPEAKTNITDPESRIMQTASGWVQGYNCQASVNEHQIVVAKAVTQDPNDVGQLVPMMEASTTTPAAAGIEDKPGRALADAGYWSEANATAPGPDRLIATTKDWKQRQAARALGETTGPPPQDASPLEAMEHRLRTPEGSAAYARRSSMVEPVFGQGKENRGFRRFTRRGLTAANSEWSLICATGNLLKLFTHAAGRPLAAIAPLQA
jgi:transposase